MFQQAWRISIPSFARSVGLYISKKKLIQKYFRIFTNFIPNFHVTSSVNEKPVAIFLSVIATFALVAISTEVVSAKAYATLVNEGIIVYEQPTNITQLSKIPMQIFIGLGVALAAIAIIVLYRSRK